MLIIWNFYTSISLSLSPPRFFPSQNRRKEKRKNKNEKKRRAPVVSNTTNCSSPRNEAPPQEIVENETRFRKNSIPQVHCG